MQDEDDQRDDMQRPPNMSSFDDPSIPPPHLPSNSSSVHLFRCFSSRLSVSFFSALLIIYAVLLPLLVLVLSLGVQRWRRRRSTSTSHSDVFTYHSVVMQLSEFLGVTFVFCGGYMKCPLMMEVGVSVWSFTSFGQALFHVLTCVERYLAVVHPVTYRGLKEAGGVRIRNISVGCVWLLSFGWMALKYMNIYVVHLILYFCLIIVFFIIFLFFTISVLCALKRPGPGEVGGNRERVDQSKQRAFNIITAVMGVLLVGFVGNLLFSTMHSFSVFGDMCVELLSSVWFNLPSRFLIPLLFLQRAGKLRCFKQDSGSG